MGSIVYYRNSDQLQDKKEKRKQGMADAGAFLKARLNMVPFPNAVADTIDNFIGIAAKYDNPNYYVLYEVKKPDGAGGLIDHTYRVFPAGMAPGSAGGGASQGRRAAASALNKNFDLQPVDDNFVAIGGDIWKLKLNVRKDNGPNAASKQYHMDIAFDNRADPAEDGGGVFQYLDSVILTDLGLEPPDTYQKFYMAGALIFNRCR